VGVAAGDALAAADVTIALADAVRAWASDAEEADHEDRAHAELRRQVATLARVAQDGLHEHRDLVAPHVEVLLDLRARARADGRFGDADMIRGSLEAAGIDVRDTPAGTGWILHDPTGHASADPG
jgi:cysteinyl-tRNA synthetase